MTKTVLALSFNTRTMAVAVMRGTTLLHYQTSLFKERWSYQKQKRILIYLAKLLLTYQITDLALSLPYESHTTDNLESLFESLSTFFKNQKIPICSYNQEAYSVFYEEGYCQRKKAMMETISRLYPELERLYKRELRNKNKYYVRLFEAVGLAHVHSQSISQREHTKEAT